MFNADKNLMEKWGPVLDHESVNPIQDNYKKAVTARLLENQEVALQEERNQAQGNFISESFYFFFSIKKILHYSNNKDNYLSFIYLLLLIFSVISFNNYTNFGNDASTHIFFFLFISDNSYRLKAKIK